jgi:hypothetical protein
MPMAIRTYLITAVLTGAVLLAPLPALAGSCCGGGGGAGLVMPKYFKDMVDLSFDYEKYHGFWDQYGQYTPDPAGSDLKQYRLNFGYAHRFSPRWQASVTVPYVVNRNDYSGISTTSWGPGDATVSFWYEALDDISAWKVRSLKDMQPSVLIGPSLLIPTGISPYDDIPSSFDVTGRGFYRLDGNMIVSKTLHPVTASLSLSYGTYLERKVNEEYGNYVEPYSKKLGDRTFASLSAGYIAYVGTAGDALTTTLSFDQVREANASIDGVTDPASGFRKDSLGVALAYSNTDSDWKARLSWNHAVRINGWGVNFPCTDIYTVGVSYGFQ